MSWGDKYYVRLRLSRWGRWGAENGPVMLPSIFGRLMASGGSFTGSMKEIPQEIAEIDSIIGRAPDDLKHALIDYYQRGRRLKEHAAQRGITSWAFLRLVRRAEGFVQGELF